MQNQTVNDGKTMAIISYITIIGTIIAFIMNNNTRNSFASFHIRQMIGIFLLSMLNKYLIYDLLGATAGFIVFAMLVVFWFIGFLGAIKGEEKLVPIIGDKFQELFKGI
jgi:uncharacterized membrane protein